MDVLDWVKSLGRQWAATLLFLAMAAGAVFAVSSLVDTRYEARGSVVLLGPNSYPNADGVDIAVNPYARYGSSGEAVTASTLVAILMSPASVRAAEASGFPGEYVVAGSSFGGGGIIDITVASDTAKGSIDGVGILIEDLEDLLLSTQLDAGAPESSLIRSTTLTLTEEAESLEGARVRAVAVTAALGLGLTCIVVRGIDVARRRERGRSRTDSPAGAADPLLPVRPGDRASGKADDLVRSFGTDDPFESLLTDVDQDEPRRGLVDRARQQGSPRPALPSRER